MYPKINYLAQAYFHQDYDLEADSPIAIVSLFREREVFEVVEALSGEIFSILASGADESRLASIWLDEAGACYDPREDGVSIQDWLSRVGEVLLRG
ncbi:contact-dependent growth inhibition system immunity protein [Streptomyces sp. NRRL S-31]|uniref:contact-dependent growth inhibition system immunity protein n=1 Tax=Streptomyces sp. NRRL S-31 TaxID=1463898 RepID=UPI0007C7EDEA|nr:contact-dependent growth inhibition system immunity protein [Streptomyces sp. NRRL S-31]